MSGRATTRPRARQLSAAQVAVLKNLAVGRDPKHGLVGRSEHGGAEGTLASLCRRGLATGGAQHAITTAGHEALRVHRRGGEAGDRLLAAMEESWVAPWWAGWIAYGGGDFRDELGRTCRDRRRWTRPGLALLLRLGNLGLVVSDAAPHCPRMWRACMPTPTMRSTLDAGAPPA